jgi:thioredoxin 1
MATEINFTDNIESFKTDILQNNPGLVILKFSAEWCGPCKQIASHVKECVDTLPDTVSFYEIDIDKYIKVYGHFLNKKMVRGIPAMLCWEKRNRTLIPDDSVNSSSISEVNQFFERCVELLD